MMFGLILHSELQEGRGSATASVRSGSPVPPPYTPYDDSQVAGKTREGILARYQR